MMRITIVFWLLALSLHSFCQDCSGKIPQSYLDRFNNRVLRSFREANQYPLDSVVLIDIIDVGYPDYGNIDKEYFEEGNFLSDIFPSYYRPKGKLRKVIDAYAILFNESKDFVAYADNFFYYEGEAFKGSKEMAKLIVQSQIECVYHLSGVFWGGIYIGVGTDRTVFLLKNQGEHPEIWLLKDYPDDEWKSLFSDTYFRRIERWYGDDMMIPNLPKFSRL